MSRPAGVVFDVDGTLAESEQRGHRVAFNRAFEEAGLPDRWEEQRYRELLRVAGGRQRLAHYFVGEGRDGQDADRLAAELHPEKTRLFQEMVRGGEVPLRAGAKDLVARLGDAGMRLFVATTGTRAWVDALLTAHFSDGTFEQVVTGTEVPDLKPSPAVYERVVELAGTDDLVAVEDSANGLMAAHAAGLACLVVLNGESHGDFSPAELVLDGFGPAAGYVSGAAGPGAVVDGVVDLGTFHSIVGARGT